ncbi:hypothetical protein U1Q18_004418 [Sarracenia purpurea var. burkii]
MASSYRDWAWLPVNLLDSILENLDQFSDYVRFNAVCQQWRRVAMEDKGLHKQGLSVLKTSRNKLPMLMIETKESHGEKWVLFSVAEGKTYELKLPFPYHCRFLGSSLGWLFTIEKTTMAITLLNPFSGQLLHLPVFKDPFDEFQYWVEDDTQDYFVCNGIISSDPFSNPNDYEVVVIYGGMRRLAFLKSSDGSWKFINTEPDYVFSNVIYYKSLVLAVNTCSDLVQIDMARGDHKALTARSTTPASFAYLVESNNGNLLLVQRFWKSVDEEDEKNLHIKTHEFKVFTLLRPAGQKRPAWVQIKDLGDQALFVGDNYSVCVSTSKFPQYERNCIYYTDQNHAWLPPYAFQGLDDDSGIFNFENGSFRSHYLPDSFKNQTLPPIWFVPNMKGA